MSSSKILPSNTPPKLEAPTDIFDDAREFVGGTSPAAWWLRCELAPMVSQLIDLLIRSFVKRIGALPDLIIYRCDVQLQSCDTALGE